MTDLGSDKNASNQFVKPRIFDWFIAMLAISVGLSTMLISNCDLNSSLQRVTPFLFTFQVMYVCSGLGLLIYYLFRAQSFWYYLFRGLLVLAFFVSCLIGFIIKDYYSVLIFVLLSFLTLLTTIDLHRSEKKFGLFVYTFALLFPCVYLISPSEYDVSFLHFHNRDRLVVAGIWFFLILLAGLIALIIRKKGAKENLIIVFGGGIFFVLISFWMVDILAWQKSIILLVVGITCFILRPWREFNFKVLINRYIFLALFLFTNSLIFLYIFSLLIIQNNTMLLEKSDLKDKIYHAKNLVEEIIEEDITTLEFVALNKELKKALKERDENILAGFTQVVYYSQFYLSRVVIADPDGEILTVYPNGKDLDGSLNYKENFYGAKEKRDTYIFDKLLSMHPEQQLILTITTPVFGEKDEVLGYLSMVLDKNRIEHKLQQLANIEKGQFFFMMDENGKIIFHPDKSIEGRMVNIGEMKENEVIETFGFDNEMILQTSISVDSVDWLIVASSLVEELLNPIKIVGIIAYTIILTFIGGLILVFYLMRKKFY